MSLSWIIVANHIVTMEYENGDTSVWQNIRDAKWQLEIHSIGTCPFKTVVLTGFVYTAL